MATINPDLSLSGHVAVVQGSAADWPIRAANADGSIPVFAAGDVPSAVVFPGAGLTALFSPAAAWTGGTGYSTGNVTVSPTSAQTVTLEAGGDHQLQVWWTAADLSRTACIARRILSVLPAAGTGTRAIIPYCTLKDMLEFAPWLAQLSGGQSDVEGFYDHRLRARQWLDWAITNNYRGASAGSFEQLSELAFAWGGGVGWRRGQGPSPSMVLWLSQNLLLIRPQIVEASAYKAASYVGLGQIGVNAQQVAMGVYCRDMADRVLCATTAEIDLNGDGVGEIPVNLGSTNTLFT